MQPAEQREGGRPARNEPLRFVTMIRKGAELLWGFRVLRSSLQYVRSFLPPHANAPTKRAKQKAARKFSIWTVVKLTRANLFCSISLFGNQTGGYFIFFFLHYL